MNRLRRIVVGTLVAMWGQYGTAVRPAGAEVVGRVPLGEAILGERFSISGNGRFVAMALGSVPDCGEGVQPPNADIVVYDRKTSQLECVNVNSQGVRGPGYSGQPSMSADGTLVAFTSDAPNLDPRCSGLHVYVRNRRSGRTECISRPNAGGAANFGMGTARISADGSVVVFESSASNLVDGDSNHSIDVFAARLVDGARVGPIEMVSVPFAGFQGRAGGDAAMAPDVSADGRFVVFQSARHDLVPGKTAEMYDIYWRDRGEGRTIRVSVSNAGQQADASSGGPGVSSDGRFVVFTSVASNLIAGGTTMDRLHVYRHDVQTKTTILVSRSVDGHEGNNSSVSGGIGADGRTVLFSSAASNLTRNDTNGSVDVFTAQIEGDEVATSQISVATDGVTQQNRDVHYNAMSADGGTIAFMSQATNLIDGIVQPSIYLARIPSGQTRVITGAGIGGGAQVRAVDAQGRMANDLNFIAYDRGFAGGVNVAYGDVDGDGAPDVITAAGPGGGPHVRVLSAARHNETAPGVRHELASFNAYDPSFLGGVSVAVGDVTGDGVGDIITGAGIGGGPHVRVFEVHTSWATGTATISEYTGFFAYSPLFTGGVRVAAGDLDGDGVAEIITAAGPGGGAHVLAFSLTAAHTAVPVASFMAYDPAFRYGVNVAAGDLDGDGRDEIITGADAGGSPHVRAFSVADAQGFGMLWERCNFLAYDREFRSGVRVAAGDFDGDGRVDILTAPGPYSAPLVRAFRPTSWGTAREIASFMPYNPLFGGGVYIAAVPH